MQSAITIWSENLALGVGIGTLIALMFFARRVANATQVRRLAAASSDTTICYTVSGFLLFASSHTVPEQFDYTADQGHAAVCCAAV